VPDDNDDPTGLTDDESDVGKSQEVIEEVLPLIINLSVINYSINFMYFKLAFTQLFIKIF
jgi:hypothetical protein